MNPEHRKLIEDKRFELAECIKLDVIISFIISEKIFTKEMLDDIYNRDKKEQVAMFLEELPTRGPHAFIKFVRALTFANQKKALEVLGYPEIDMLKTNENSSEHSVIDKTYMNKQVNLKENVKEKYSMNSYGLCLIINNVKFETQEYRYGSDLDAERLDITFKYLNFKVFMRRNLKGHDMYTCLKYMSNHPELENVDSLVIVILTHGDKDILYGTDEIPLNILDILELFNNRNCENLIGKPKMFFINACRGNNADCGVPVKKSKIYSQNMETNKYDEEKKITEMNNQTSSDSSKVILKENSEIVEGNTNGEEERIATLTDMVISYSTIINNISIRNHVFGSWYCTALVNVFTQYASSEELYGLLLRVEQEVRKFISASGERQTTEKTFFGWNKHLYFNVCSR